MSPQTKGTVGSNKRRQVAGVDVQNMSKDLRGTPTPPVPVVVAPATHLLRSLSLA